MVNCTSEGQKRLKNEINKQNAKNMKETIITKGELNELNQALINAVNTAAMLDDTEDGGTCNFDMVTLKIKIPKKFIQYIYVKLEKMYARDWGRLWRGYYLVDIPLSGQGYRRTRMAEAACQALKDAGYDARVYYQCD